MGRTTGWQVINTILYHLAFAFSFTTSIEMLPAASAAAFAYGEDVIGEYLLHFSFVTALASQLPKRFMFRSRPFEAGRAVQTHILRTSSFPSRAVVCSVVYPLVLDHFGWVNLAWVLPLAILLNSWARVYLGVHYPSDWVVGSLLGIAIFGFGEALWQIGERNISWAYRTCHSDIFVFSGEKLALVVGLVVVCVVVAVLLQIPPLCFWEKCSYMLGTCSGLLVFRFALLTPGYGSTSLRYGTNHPLSALLTFFLSLGLSDLANKVKLRRASSAWNTAISFSFVLLLSFGCLGFWRIWNN